MGGLCKTDVTPTTTSTSVLSGTQIPEWVSKGGQELWEQSRVLAQRPYQTYDAPRVANQSADETTAQTNVRDQQGDYQPYLDTAKGLTQTGSQQWNGTVAANYMNPYQTAVTDIAAREMQRNFDINQTSRDAAAVKAGAFGSARHGVVDAEAQRNLTQSIGDLYAKGQSEAYNNAQQAFNADRQAALAGAGQMSALGQLGQTLGYQDADMLMRSGEKQTATGQKQLDTAYQDFLRQQDWPYQQVNWATGVLKGVPYNQTSTSQQTGTQLVQSPSVLGQLAGLGMAGAGMYSMLK